MMRECVQKAPKWHQDGPRLSQNKPKWSRHCTLTFQQMALKCSRAHFEASKQATSRPEIVFARKSWTKSEFLAPWGIFLEAQHTSFGGPLYLLEPQDASKIVPKWSQMVPTLAQNAQNIAFQAASTLTHRVYEYSNHFWKGSKPKFTDFKTNHTHTNMISWTKTIVKTNDFWWFSIILYLHNCQFLNGQITSKMEPKRSPNGPKMEKKCPEVVPKWKKLSRSCPKGPDITPQPSKI